jgi:phage tail-like protein
MDEVKFKAIVEAIRLADDKTSDSFTHPVMDSEIAGCRWHRAIIEADIPENASISLYFQASDRKEDLSRDFDGNYRALYAGRSRDALLQGKNGEPLQGQYLNIKAELFWNRPEDGGKISVGKKGDDLLLRSIKIYYPRISYLRYLPAIYQRDEESRRFLERFLSIFESSLMESDEIISNIQRYFDPLAAPEEFVPWLASWLSLDLYDLIEERNNRDFILNAVDLYRWKGTVTGLVKLGTILTGCKCVVVKEYENNVFRTFGAEAFGAKACDHYAPTTDDDVLRFHRNVSLTVDTGNRVLLENKGTYLDEIHYISGRSASIDSISGAGSGGGESNGIEYLSNSVGLFFVLDEGESLPDSKVKLIKRIIDSFLPALVNVRIEVVSSKPLINALKSDAVKEEGEELQIEMVAEDEAAGIGKYRYWNGVNWKLILTQDKDRLTDDNKFRTFHDQICDYGEDGQDKSG